MRPVSITHKEHFVNIARRRASEANRLAAKQREASSKMECNGPAHANGDGSVHANGDASQQDECLPPATNCKGGFFADQFENLANFRAHYEDTGPEIWDQTEGDLHAFIAAAGTGGTLAGVSRFLKVFSLNPLSVLYYSNPLLVEQSNVLGPAEILYLLSFSGKGSQH